MAGIIGEEQRAKAIAAYVATNSAEQAAQVAGVSGDSVLRWIAERPEDIERLRIELQKQLLPGIIDAIKGFLIKLIEAAGENGIEIKSAKDSRDAAIAFGTLIDKARIILGIPDRVEHSGTIMHDINDLQARQRELEGRRRALMAEFGEIVDVEVRPE